MKCGKIIKKIALVTAAIFCIFTLGGCESFTEQSEPLTPPFFTIRNDETGGVVYMLGTMHVAENGVQYPEEIYEAIDECETVAVEVDLIALDKNQDAVNEAMTLLECKTGTTADILGEDYGKIKAFFLEKGLYNMAYDRYLPTVWSSMLSNKMASDCGYYAENGTDRAVIQYAMKKNKNIFEFESIYEQYKMNSEESPALQAFVLKDAAETDYDDQLSAMRELYKAWSEGDISALEKMLESDSIPEELSDDYADYYAAMYTDRQEKMAEKISEWLENGEKVFVAVGAMHFAAAPDILDLLEE